jgi:hypothetical protein
MSNPKIFIVAGYKTGSTTLEHTFKCSKTHNIDFESKINEHIDVILMPFRDNYHTYISAYFQDLIVPDYEYSPFNQNNFLGNTTKVCQNGCGTVCAKTCNEKKYRMEIINRTDVDTLINHFQTIDWDKYIHLNNIKRIDTVNKKYNIKIDYTSNVYQVFNIKIKNKMRKLVCFNTNILSKKFDNLKQIIYGKPMKNIQLHYSNQAKEKWYAKVYKEFGEKIEHLKSNYS